MVTTRAEAAQYLKDAGGLKLVVFGADGHEVADTGTSDKSLPGPAHPNYNPLDVMKGRGLRSS